MASVRARTLHGRRYYYLAETARIEGKVRYFERYLGRVLPPNLESIRRDLRAEVRAARWYPRLADIREEYRRAMVRLPDTARNEQIERFGIEFTYHTNRIEGSSLTLRETAAIIARGVAPRAKPLADILEAKAHQEVYRSLLTDRRVPSIGLVLEWHAALFAGTKADIAGKLRTYPVGIGGSRFVPPPPEEVGPLLRRLFRWSGERRREIHPVELAGILHLRFETIHPFGDGNGRVGRLLMNYLLHRSGFPMWNIRYEEREAYYDALERVHGVPGELSFLDWFLRSYTRHHGPRVRPGGSRGPSPLAKLSSAKRDRSEPKRRYPRSVPSSPPSDSGGLE